MSSSRLSFLFLCCALLWGCHVETSPEATLPPQNFAESQFVELPQTGLSLHVPDDWTMQKQEHTNPATDIVNALVTNGDLSEESIRQGRGDAIHITSIACNPAQSAGLTQIVLQQDRTKLIDEFQPGDPFMPFANGMGYEVEFGHAQGDSLMGSRAFIYETISGDRCYKLSLENRRDAFEEKRETYAAIMQSVRFSEK